MLSLLLVYLSCIPLFLISRKVRRPVMGSLRASRSLRFSGLCGRLGGVATLISVAVADF